MAGGSGSKREMNFYVNLTPTSDLLSCLVSFLLITAVWTQLERINVGNVVPKGSTRPSESQAKKKPLKLLVTQDGVRIKVHGDDSQSEYFPLGEDMLTNLSKYMEAKGFKEETSSPDNKVVLAVANDVFYALLISGMDVCLDSGLVSISVVDESAFKG